MALDAIRRSDLSGEVIPDGKGARVRVMYYDPERTDRRADLTDAEVDKLIPFAEEVRPRPERRNRRH